MKPIRALEVQTRLDTFRITIFERSDGSHYGEAQGTKVPFLSVLRIGSPVISGEDCEQGIAKLITDCVNKVISLAGPVTHMERLPNK